MFNLLVKNFVSTHTKITKFCNYMQLLIILKNNIAPTLLKIFGILYFFWNIPFFFGIFGINI